MNIETSELSLAAALLTLGFVPNVKKSNNQKVIFSFEQTQELEKAINDFWNNNLELNPKLYWNAVRELKSRIQLSRQLTVGGKAGE